MPSGLVAGAGKKKEDVNYRQNERCSVCVHFYPLNSCELVQGNISPEAMCNLFEIRKKDGGKDGQFYLDEHSKMAGKTDKGMM